MQFRYTLIDYTSGSPVSTVVHEPIGWDNLTLKLERDKEYHGFFEYSDDELSGLKFFDTGREILKTAFDNFGVEARIDLQIEINCNGVWQTPPLFTGRVDFDRSRFDCGLKGCFAEVSTSKTNCLMTLRNRWDQKVDLDAPKAFDGTTDLTDYTYTNFEVEIPPKKIKFSYKAQYKTPGFINYTILQPTALSQRHFITPTFDVETENSLADIANYADIYTDTDDFTLQDFADSYDGLLKLSAFSKLYCANTVHVKWRAKGHFQESSAYTTLYNFVARVHKIAADGTITSEYAYNIHSNGGTGVPVNIDFTINADFSVPMAPGDRLYFYFCFDPLVITTGVPGTNGLTLVTLNFTDSDDYHTIELLSESTCETTKANVYLINEALSRTAEAITNDCLRVYSSYFGRPDAQPYANGIDVGDGCGALEVITNGLKLRNALMKDSSLPKMQVSFKDLVEGLNAIHNIGYGLEDDPFRANYKMLRVEPFAYFYDSSTTLFSALNVPQLKTSILADEYVSLFKNGYAKWEAEEFGGQEDFYGQREFTTLLTTITKTLDKVCKFIASPYAIEATRREQGVNNKDWRYDNDTFIICVKRKSDEPFYEVERQNIYVQHHIYDPDGEYNIRISPARNALRWCKRIAQSLLPNWAGNILKFTAGQGNIVAEALMNSTFCRLENSTLFLAEGKNIYHNDNTDTVFENEVDVQPIMYNILDEFEYPLSFTDYQTLTTTPYGMIEYSCNNGSSIFGFIKSITYKPTDGKATFQLIRAYLP